MLIYEDKTTFKGHNRIRKESKYSSMQNEGNEHPPLQESAGCN